MDSGRVSLLPEYQSLVEDDPRWDLVQRIVASRQFTRAPLLSRFLVYICSKTLSNQEHEISEYQIGVQVFSRPKGYRTVEDNIVRNYARQLRKRLTEYFTTEGQSEQLRIEIPLGSYVPLFVAHASLPSASVSEPLHETDADSSEAAVPVQLAVENGHEASKLNAEGSSWKSRLGLAASLFVYSAILVAATMAIAHHTSVPQQKPTDLMTALWSSLFREPLDTFVVPADCGLNLLEDISKRQMSLDDYLRGDYRTLSLPELDEHSKIDLRTQEFTSFVDLHTVAAISRLPQVDPQRMFVRFPRDLSMDDLKDHNIILLGSVGSNPWAEIAQRNLNFRIEYSKEMNQAWVVNKKPCTGEADRYLSRWSEPTHTTYAVIAYQLNLSGNGHLFLIQGLDVAGTQAAAEALLHGTILDSVLHAASQKSGAFLPFEILLQITSVESNATNAHVVAYRLGEN